MKKHRGIRRLVISLAVTILIAGMPIAGYRIYAHYTEPWYERYSLIAHAMGEIDGVDYTNSKEAFEQNYEKGYRVFEVDFRFTSDGVLVGRHDWKQSQDQFGDGKIPTAEEFLDSRIQGTYTPLSFADVLQLAKDHPDVYIMTDTKYGDLQKAEETMQYMAQTAEELGLVQVLKKQFIIQIYNDEMYAPVKQWIDPENILYTVYQLEPEEYNRAALFCTEQKIPIVAVRFKRWDDKVQEMFESVGLKTAVHTINDPTEAEAYFESHVSCLYSDVLEPADF